MFTFRAGEERTITVAYEITPRCIERPYDLKSVQYGSLIFSLPIAYEKVMHEYERDGVERKFPYCDYEYVCASDWNYALAGDSFTVVEKQTKDGVFSSEEPPLVLMAEMKKIDWGYEDGFETVCAKVPESRLAIGETEIKALYPYGCAKLRITEMPLI